MLPKTAVNKGQAIAELAILATILMILFGMILSYGQRYDRMEETKMQAFRKALQLSFWRNAGVNYTLKRDNRGADLFAFSRGTPITTVGTASVLWQKGAPGTNTEHNNSYNVGSYAFYEVNGRLLGQKEGADNLGADGTGGGLNSLPRVGQTYHPHTTDGSDNPQQIMTPVSIWKENSKHLTNYDLGDTRSEDATAVTNTKTAALNDTIKSSWLVRRPAATDVYQDDSEMYPTDQQVKAYSDYTTYTGAMHPYVTRQTRITGLTSIYNQDGTPNTSATANFTAASGTSAIKNDIQYCDPTNDPNCTDAAAQSGVLPAAKTWKTNN